MRSYLRISGAVFGVIAALHLVRLLRQWPAQVGDWTVPFWVSWIAVIAPGALCLWAFRLVRQAPSSSAPSGRGGA